MTSLVHTLRQRFADQLVSVTQVLEEVTVELPSQYLLDASQILRDAAEFQFDMLIDLCGVDYADYGLVQWVTEAATDEGFSRGVEQGAQQQRILDWDKPRFAVVYHLLSTTLNQRLRLRVFCEQDPLWLDSVVTIWESANWYEREAYDLYGILFRGHPDMRRLLTDYGFIGHPFRKDFPLSGQVEMRYDAKQQRVIYEPVNIEPRVLVPKVGRRDNRYLGEGE
ncbi:MAG: NADH-quinone oxidoreductase subunit C [Legionellales bacterium]|nr:NADH-quinone oxidoreductase subunit C [Legionellales bacterium]